MFKFINILILISSFLIVSCGEEKIDKRISSQIQTQVSILCDASIYGDDCNNVDDFVLVKKTELKPENIIKGEKIGGVSGTAEMGSTVEECSSDNEIGCITTDKYRSIDIDPYLDSILSSKTILGKRGTLLNCSEGEDSCYINDGFKAVDSENLVSSNIKSGVSLGGVLGDFVGDYEACSAEGTVGCITTSTYKPINIATHTSKIISSASILGTTGTFVVPPTSVILQGGSYGVDGGLVGTVPYCSESGSGCYLKSYSQGVSGYKLKALDYDNLSDNTSKIKKDYELVAGIVGTQPECSSGESSCYIDGSDLTAVESENLLATNIKHGVHLGEITGVYNGDYESCSAEGTIGCITTSTYKPVNISTHASKIISSESILGTTGTFVVPSTSSVLQSASYGVGGALVGTVPYCSESGSGCYLKSYSQGVSGYQLKALDYDNLSDNTSKIKKDYELVAGIVGTQPECSSGESSCYIEGSDLTAVESENLLDINIKHGVHLGEITGVYNGDYENCSAEGTIGCITTSTYKPVNISTHASKIISSESILGTTGTFVVPSTSNVLQSASYGVGGALVGTVPYCSESGSGCYLKSYSQGVSGYKLKALDYDSIYSNRSNIKNGYELVSGITGTQSLCLAGRSSCYIDGSALTAVESENLLATNIKHGVHLGEITGVYNGDYENCSAEGTIGCITTSTYKPVNISTHASKIISSESILGTTGTFVVPSTSNVLQSASYGVGGALVGTVPYCSETGSGCYLKSYSQGVSGYKLKALDYDSIYSNRSNIKNGYELVSGITGNQSVCSAGNSSCYIDGATYKAAESSLLLASNIKKDVILGGVTGNYPSALSPLTGATVTTDLTSSNFNDLIVDSSSFEWFDSAGNRYTGNGDSDLVASNIKNTVGIFNVVGSFEGSGGGPANNMMVNTAQALAFRKDDGSVICKGNSDYGGDCDSLSSSLVDVVDVVAAGRGAFAALKSGGSVVAWGNSSYGGSIPAELESFLSSGVTKIFSTGSAFAALKEDPGSVVAWGNSSYGGSIPAGSVSDLSSGVTDIYSNGSAFVALKRATGAVIAWGNSGYGGDASYPVGGSLSSGVTDIFHNAGGAFAALKSGGSVVTWGPSSYGGDQTYYDSSSGNYIDVSSNLTSGVKKIYSTYGAFAALKNDRTVVTWGDSYQGGDSSAVQAQLTDVIDIASTQDSMAAAFAALKADGSVVAWGYSDHGGDTSSAVGGTLSSGVVKIFSNQLAFAALKLDGSVVTWGYIGGGGDFTRSDEWTTGAPVGSLSSGVVNILSTQQAFVALKEDGSVVSWGSNSGGGDSSINASLTSGVVNVYPNKYRSAFAALKEDGSVVAWGDSLQGGNTSSVLDYTGSSSLSGIVKVFAGQYLFMGVREDESYVVWGGYYPY